MTLAISKRLWNNFCCIAGVLLDGVLKWGIGVDKLDEVS